MNNSIPAEDFIHPSFDTTEKKASKLLLLLSSPRSGSTMLSERLHNWDVCLTHEYFQPFQYLPALADRWKCLEDGVVDRQRYVDALFTHRSSKSEWLGINLHGSHVASFMEYFSHFPKLEVIKIIHLRRKDSLKQAISYEIASQTGQWSSHFKSAIEPVYDYDKLKKKLDRVDHQTRTNLAFIDQEKHQNIDVFYEDLKRDSKKIRDFLGVRHDGGDQRNQMSKQSNEINREWLNRLSKDLLGEAR